MLFIADNQKDFLSSAYVHGLDTRNKNHLYLPVVSLACVQKGVSFSGVKKKYIYIYIFLLTRIEHLSRCHRGSYSVFFIYKLTPCLETSHNPSVTDHKCPGIQQSYNGTALFTHFSLVMTIK